MQLAPRAELERFAREQYQKEFGAVPAKVRNATAIVALGEPRPLRFRNQGYTVPPIHFPVGMKMLVIQHALEANPHDHRSLKLARQFLHGVVRTKRFCVGEKRKSGRVPLRNPFRRIDAPTAVSLISQLLYVPDETPQSGPPAKTIDFMDGLLEFVRLFPAWAGDDGMPISWAHYQYGVRHIGRVLARETLKTASASRVAQADQKAFKAFALEHRLAAGWSN